MLHFHTRLHRGAVLTAGPTWPGRDGRRGLVSDMERGLGLRVCSDCPEKFREVPRMAGFVIPKSGKFWEAPGHFCSSWTNVSVVEEAEWCGEVGCLLRRGSVVMLG